MSRLLATVTGGILGLVRNEPIMINLDRERQSTKEP